MPIKLFDASKLSCPCKRSDCNVKIAATFLERLTLLAQDFGKPLLLTSGARCIFHNKSVKGKPGSYHLLGRAVDLYVASKNDMENLIILAEKYGFNGIGTGKTLLHLDDRSKKARWTY